ncbi:DNA binding domain-containing protein, excisionase family [Bacteroides luti]|uniref:DNA binding domain-containing protein, excisionase family n=1 Tax=Bacteroides luti TaxID=1297750 RepID=A0A1M4XP40_9BACE|nr:helix-turn-helix domain-containing protein [Bacteroides luti]SHE95136.1 DNA binding domain-containing protein, excisionase family [Bacteroides luti]
MNEELMGKLDRIEKLTLLSVKNVLNIEDVSLLTGLSKGFLYKMTCRNEIPFYKPNNKNIFFDRADVESWMKRNKIASTEEIDQKANNYVVNGKKGGL